MTRVDLHPEDLFDHLRRGEIRDDERQRLDRHCAQCSACAFELALVDASPHEAAPSQEDHAVAARAMEQMWLAEPETHAVVSTADDGGNVAAQRVQVDEDLVVVGKPRPAPSHALFRAVALLLAGVLVGGSVSAAALTGGSPLVLVELITAWVTPGPTEPAQTASDNAQQTRRRRSQAAARHDRSVTAKTTSPIPGTEAAPPDTEAAQPSALAIAPAATTLPSSVELPVTASSAVVVRRANPSLAVGVAGGPAPIPPTNPLPPTDPASWLFRAASRARSAGRYHEAAALYGVLQRDYAGSETEVVARVALGRLWIGHLNDPAAALDAFNRYLQVHVDGPLSEEARSGRVAALQRLGRTSEAEQARQDLLTHHPTTLYAKTVTGTP